MTRRLLKRAQDVMNLSSTPSAPARVNLRLVEDVPRTEVELLTTELPNGTSSGAQLVVVANRLPFKRDSTQGPNQWSPSPGGLVTSMNSVVAGLGLSTAWIGWDGVPSDQDGEELLPWTSGQMTAIPLSMSTEELSGFYDGFANGTLWPLYHDAIRRPSFDAATWSAYVSMNKRFADAAASAAAPSGVVWVHDYHLQLVPQMLRERRPDLRIGFFLHIPFPPPELFLQLPWRHEILEGLLGADVIGFQVPSAVRNFGTVVNRLDLASGAPPALRHEGRSVKVASYPASISADFGDDAGTPDVRAAAQDFRDRLQHPRTVILGVDRLDYTKGIEGRFEAFRTLLAEDGLKASDVVLVQVAVPSREDVEFYRTERENIERLVGDINGQFGEVGAPVIHYLYRSLDQAELLALYCAADIALVTPYRDGMNLVAKEYVKSRVDGDGVLILSEFAGAARELRQALLVNPHDAEQLVAALRAAIAMPKDEQARRMRRLRKAVSSWTATDWAQSFLSDLGESV
jgi:trehalose 6-phosphate synthase